MTNENINLKKMKLTFRKLKLSDYQKFEKLFYLSFKKKISYKFFKWRYFTDKLSFCYGAFESSNLIANSIFEEQTLYFYYLRRMNKNSPNLHDD